jgi:hypothetical protein
MPMLVHIEFIVPINLRLTPLTDSGVHLGSMQNNSQMT